MANYKYGYSSLNRKKLNQVVFNDIKVTYLESLDRVFYMRAVLGLIAGIIAGFVIPPGTNQNTAAGVIILIGMIFYIMSYGVAKGITRNIPQNMRRKLATNGIFPFIFLLLMFMIIVYTGLHQAKIAG